MTKIKNTKKGMAKKTLSISLAVAMLATSNVPVWAAEFTDGSEAVFTSEVEAPAAEVVEEAPVVEEEIAEVAENQNVTVNVALAGDVVWGNTISTKAGTGITYKAADGSDKTMNQFSYIWRDATTHRELIKGTDVENSVITSGSVTDGTLPSLATNKLTAGKNIELYLYRDTTDGYSFEYVTNAVTVKAKDISDYVFLWDGATDNLKYDGKTSYRIKPVSAGLSGDGNSWNGLDEYNVEVSYDRKENEFVNAGTVNVFATANGPAYTGTIKGSYEIKKADKATAADIEVKVEDGATFAYTGNQINFEAIVGSKNYLTAKDLHTGEDLTAAITTASGYGTTVGEYGVGAKFDLSKLNNYADYEGSNGYGLQSEGKFEITTRDLANDTNISIRPLQHTGNAFSAADILSKLTFTDKAGNALNIKNDVTVTVDEDKEIKEVGTYTVTVKAKTTNTVGEQKVTVSVEQHAINEYALGTATEANGHVLNINKEFTDSEITLKKEDLGKLYIKSGDQTNGKEISANLWDIKGYENNVHAGKATVLIELKKDSGYEGKVLPVYFTINAATVTKDTVKAPEKVVYDRDVEKAEEYRPAITVKAKNAEKPAKEFTLVEGTDYKLSYNFTSDASGSAGGNKLGNYVETIITILNTDFGEKNSTIKVYSEIAYKSLTKENIVIDPETYVYTGGVITPEFKVVDGGKELTKGTHYTVVDYTKAPNVGTATLTIKGNPEYGYDDTEVKATYEITAAKAEDLTVTFKNSYSYTGKPIYPTLADIEIKLGDNKITDQFNIDYGTNINAGTDAGSIILTPKKGNLNFTGSKTATFTIKGKTLTGKLTIYNEKGGIVTNFTDYFTYDGAAKQFSDVKFVPSVSGLVEGEDYEIKYIHNVYGKGYVYVVGKGNYVGTDSLTAGDTTVKDVVAKQDFSIKSLKFSETNVDVKNGAYAGGLTVKPVVTVTYKGATLVEGKDYKLVVSGDSTNAYNKVTVGPAPYTVEVVGINGYEGSKATGFKWGIDKFDLANATIIVTGTDANPNVKVMNGSVVVDAEEYDLTVADGKVTVTAKADSENYVGKKTEDIEQALVKPETPMIENVVVKGNKATVILSGESEGATGYDYVISPNRNCIVDKDYTKVNKNVLKTTTDFTYVEQGSYYAYCHAWVRDENGQKVFSEWSNAYPFSVTAITPDQPAITNVKVSGSTVTVTYTAVKDANGYDVVLGTKMGYVAGERRPLEYKMVKKNQTKTTVTFKNVPGGTYFVGLHAYNRTAEDGTKVFSPWSQAQKIRVK